MANEFGGLKDYEIATRILNSSGYTGENSIPHSGNKDEVEKLAADIGMKAEDLKQFLEMRESETTSA